jgi:hypothetical protein
MTKRMLVHDQRLQGSAPFIAQNTYVVTSATTTSHVIDWVGKYAKSQGGLDELIIMCHGFALLSDPSTQTTYAEPVGGAGLQLGTPGLVPGNASATAVWKPNIQKIYLYACGVAAASARDDPAWDGRRFCGELALWSGAWVFAADRLQWYVRQGPSQTINFGTWEGHVFRYSPADGHGTPVKLGPQPT